MRLGAARSGADRACQFVQIQMPGEKQEMTRRDGHYLLRSNLTAEDLFGLWACYLQLTQIEAVFRSLKRELGIRPIHHQLEHRAGAHILVALPTVCR